MKESDKAWINQRYSQRLNEEGSTYEALRTGPWERRELRFSIIREIGIQPGDSVLDVGCGYGDFYDYLNRQGIQTNYTGFDINPDFVSIAKERYPEASFELKDINNETYDKYDWIISSSCFNLALKSQDNYEFIDEILKSAYSHCNKGVAIDLFTDYVDFKAENMFYYSPEKIFGMAKKISKRVCLRHDHPMFEFCVYIYPDFQGWAK
ncbi:MAG: class I SAM-dependent methyltransferase [Bacteroidetes bacterium]|nr:class I SAM-dependent methyltransferase [Bacteroidota bacterium]